MQATVGPRAFTHDQKRCQIWDRLFEVFLFLINIPCADKAEAAKDDTLAATEETEQEQDERVLPEIDDPNNDR